MCPLSNDPDIILIDKYCIITKMGLNSGRMLLEQPCPPFKILDTASQAMPLKRYDDRRSSSFAPDMMMNWMVGGWYFGD